MSDIGLIMNALLGVLLVGALFLGWRLESRLKALRASHQSFSQAVGDLDRAAARAEQGLADLRAATDEAADTLAARIDRAGHLAGRLEKLTAEAEGVHTRLLTAPRLEAARVAAPRLDAARPEALRPEIPRAEAPRPEAARPEAARMGSARPAESRESAFARFAERYGSARAAGPSPSAIAEAAARNDLILEDEETPAERATSAAIARLSPAAAARMERLQALARPRPAPANPAGRADEDLFEAPRRAGGHSR
jgi:hypothetical protein